MAVDNPKQGSGDRLQSKRKTWQQPELRHLAAKEARGGGNPHNDGQPGNPTPGQNNHS